MKPKPFKTILLVDDDTDDLEIFQEAILAVDPSLECQTASDGGELLNRMGSKDTSPPDIIFLDINMPQINGWECLRQLRQNPVYKSTPVIIYSTSSLDKDKQIANTLGATHFLTKPDRYDDLKNVLQTIIKANGNNLGFNVQQPAAKRSGEPAATR